MGGVKVCDESLAPESVVADDFVDLFLDEGEEGEKIEVGCACRLLSVNPDIGLTDLS